MWKKPSRPDHAISQTFNDGVLTVYRVTDSAQPGYKPQPRTTEFVKLPYEARTVGVRRYYAAQQAQVQIDRVLRVPDPSLVISPQDQAQTEDGQAYRIEQVQLVRDVWPRCLDLSLGRIDQIWPAPPQPEPDPDPDPDPQPEEVAP